MVSPKYFVAVFGKPDPPEKDTVESGVHHPNPGSSPFPTQPGDIMLPYCAGSYPGCEKRVPGVGIVLASDSKVVRYRYLPFARPVPRSILLEAFEADDLRKMGNMRFKAFWLFEISKESFVRSVGERRIDWP